MILFINKYLGPTHLGLSRLNAFLHKIFIGESTDHKQWNIKIFTLFKGKEKTITYIYFYSHSECNKI